MTPKSTALHYRVTVRETSALKLNEIVHFILMPCAAHSIIPGFMEHASTSMSRAISWRFKTSTPVQFRGNTAHFAPVFVNLRVSQTKHT